SDSFLGILRSQPDLVPQRTRLVVLVVKLHVVGKAAVLRVHFRDRAQPPRGIHNPSPHRKEHPVVIRHVGFDCAIAGSWGCGIWGGVGWLLSFIWRHLGSFILTINY